MLTLTRERFIQLLLFSVCITIGILIIKDPIRTHNCENTSYEVNCYTPEEHNITRGEKYFVKNVSGTTKDLVRYVWSKYSIQEIDTLLRFMKRKETLENSCSKLRGKITSKKCIQKGVARNMKYVKKKELLYCAIEKTGSTFWKRILHLTGAWGNVSNPTHMTEPDTEIGYRSMIGKTWTDIADTFKHSRTITFVRNPYARLFSGWLDKFYSPNPFYWKSIGKHIITTQRKQKSNDKCGYDVTFAEFVNYTVYSVLSSPCTDGHFQSYYHHCLPCTLRFDYIGKYETFKDDTMHLLDAFNMSDKIKFDDFEQDAAFQSIRDASSWVFSQQETVTNDCGVSFTCALFRVWSRLQSRGVISCNIQFPYKSKEDTTYLTKQQFEFTLTSAHKSSNGDDLKNNRVSALVKALRTLPKPVLHLVQKTFKLDFEIFGYNHIPVFSIDPTNTDTCSYFKDCPAYIL